MDPVFFSILRGVKQGDTLSAFLFDDMIEDIFQHWKCRLHDNGWMIHMQHAFLTNIRYADDIILFAKSLDELIEMLGFLKDILGEVGLDM